MSKIGFEFEFLSRLQEDEILHHLGKRSFMMTTDESIRFDKHTRKSDGWQRFELISRPKSTIAALNILNKVQSFMSCDDVATNTSCGFHINVSATNMSRFDPLTLISRVDGYDIAKKFRRENNPYCISWEFYFNEILRRVNRHETIDRKKIFIDNVKSMVKSSAYGAWINDRHKYAKIVADKMLLDKFVSINISKLQLGYVEFRMCGGTNYHMKDLTSIVESFVSAVDFAANGRNTRSINNYFSSYGV